MSDSTETKVRTMVASTSTRSGSMVTLYRTVRGYLGGSVEPVDFHSAGPGKSVEDSIAALGYRRTGPWARTPDRSDEYYTVVVPIA